MSNEVNPENQLRDRMNGKKVLHRDAKTVLTFKSDFETKRLCDGITLNLGDACAYSCSFCYVPSQMQKLVHSILAGGQFQEAVIRRRNAINILNAQLEKLPRAYPAHEPLVVYSSTLVDIAANMDLVRETATACIHIFERTAWHIRLLTKSNLLPQLVSLIPDKWHHRLILGVSTGTFTDAVAAAFELGTPKISKRLESLYWLQDRGFRTFGMICPSLPQDDYDAFARQAAEMIRADKCEHVWAEVINVRGRSFQQTFSALQGADFQKEAWALAQVSGIDSGDKWEHYARATFLAHARQIPNQKLRFLQYVTPSSREWWINHKSRGAVVLGSHGQDLPTPTNIKTKETAPKNASASRSEAAKKAWITIRNRYSPEQIRDWKSKSC